MPKVWSEEGAALAKETLAHLEAGATINMAIEAGGETYDFSLSKEAPEYRQLVLLLNRIMLGDLEGAKAMAAAYDRPRR